MNERPSLDSADTHSGSDGHLDLGFGAKRSDVVSVCLRKAFQDDIDEDVPEEFARLLKTLA
ncbi:hypothetical protein [Parasphingopyxis sp.]|uniref:hypothetical protein n=1 Tax=Parasphingopyxis sp. TaxID=1920299 RepID=UPI00260E9BA5|nr:hypothetical protein [Parasphingopyxis sp.]